MEGGGGGGSKDKMSYTYNTQSSKPPDQAGETDHRSTLTTTMTTPPSPWRISEPCPPNINIGRAATSLALEVGVAFNHGTGHNM